MSHRRSLFRQVNERIREFNARFGLDHTLPDVLLCECNRLECAARLEVPPDVYEVVRNDGLRYLVAPGHEEPAAEKVVAGTPMYLVVVAEPRAA